MAWYKKLHWQIILGLILGLVYGIVAATNGWVSFTENWIAPFGTIFLNLLKLIAVPLVVASLITGVASLSDVKKLSRIGGKTLGLYVMTTIIALTVGLVYVNVLEPGAVVPESMQERLASQYQGDIEQSTLLAEEARKRGPLQPLVEMVPENFLSAASQNDKMLQVVFFSIFAGIGLLLIPGEKSKPLIGFFEGLFELVVKMVEIIMLMAPIGVFGLLADAIVSISSENSGQLFDLLSALAWYCLVVVLGLATMVLVVYPLILKFFTPKQVRNFFPNIAPAQLVAFSTSSSGATLPVTMEVAEKNLGVSEEVSSFVLPLGATINMDGTALYQAVAAVFIAQVLGFDFTLGNQLELILLAVLASIGTAAVPSAGIVMLIIILENFGIPAAGIALIIGIDRPLDMLRTVNNITGDLAVASSVAATENALHTPSQAEVTFDGDGTRSMIDESKTEASRSAP